MKIKKGSFCVFFLVLLLLLTSVDIALAVDASSGALPWESGLTKVRNSITGPVAGAISLVAIIAAGAALIFGGDLTGFMRTSVYIVLVVGIIVSAAGLLDKLYGVSAANLPACVLLF
ncbi:MAG: TrbC/VirB2 family protein [Synergistaceae bacterium]|jgi:type IV secretion system protein VirB2|nr:TrbC/VirB2 family protein [Synergistaceae bacterium]